MVIFILSLGLVVSLVVLLGSGEENPGNGGNQLTGDNNELPAVPTNRPTLQPSKNVLICVFCPNSFQLWNLRFYLHPIEKFFKIGCMNLEVAIQTKTQDPLR